MVEVRQTEEFRDWLDGLSDQRAATRIAQRIVRVQSGLLGDVSPVGEGVSELRIHYGPGYRLYFVQRGNELVILICGGNKATQKKDIERAKALAKEV